MAKPPSEHLRAELIGVAEVCEADDVTARHRVLDHDHGWDCPDLESVAKEWSLLGVNLRLGMMSNLKIVMVVFTL